MRRIAELDSLRGLAAIVIITRHATHSVPFGWAGVDLFFVLSGYLITSIILQNREKPEFLKSFYARRALRIWPIYYLTICVLLLIDVLSHRNSTWAWWCLTYTQFTSLLFGSGASVPPIISRPTWSLAVEEQFYLVWPILAMKLPNRLFPTLAIAAMVVAFILRAAGLEEYLACTRIEGLALGIVMASNRGQWLIKHSAKLAVGLCAIFLAIKGLWLPGWESGKFTFMAFACTAVVSWVLENAGQPKLAWMRRRPLVELGMMSYGLYLYHFPILEALRGFFAVYSWPRWIPALLVGPITLVVARASWIWIEKPILEFKDRFAYATKPRSRKAHSVGSAEPLPT